MAFGAFARLWHTNKPACAGMTFAVAAPLSFVFHDKPRRLASICSDARASGIKLTAETNVRLSRIMKPLVPPGSLHATKVKPSVERLPTAILA